MKKIFISFFIIIYLFCNCFISAAEGIYKTYSGEEWYEEGDRVLKTYYKLKNEREKRFLESEFMGRRSMDRVKEDKINKLMGAYIDSDVLLLTVDGNLKIENGK